MTEIKVGGAIKITCSPEEFFIITKSPFGGFVIETAWCGDDKKYDFTIGKDVKVFIQKQEEGEK